MRRAGIDLRLALEHVLSQQGFVDEDVVDPEDPALMYVGMGWEEFMRDILLVQGRHEDGSLSGNLGLWDFQRKLVEDLFEHRFVVASTCFNTGKTYGVSALIATFLCTQKNAMVIGTGPAGRTMESQAWAEVRQRAADAEKNGHTLPGEIHRTKWEIDPLRHPKWYARWFTTNEPGRAAGFHAHAVCPADPDAADAAAVERARSAMRSSALAAGPLLLVVDEASKVDARITEQLKGVEAQENVYVLYTGNPPLSLANRNEFLKALSPRSRYRRLIVRLQEPPWKSRSKPHRVWNNVPPWMTSQRYINDRKKDWGEDSPWFTAMIYGEIPSGDASNQLINLDMLESARAVDTEKNVRSHDAYWQMLGAHIGVDCARSPKGDWNVAYIVINGVVRKRARWRGMTTDHSARKINALRARWQKEFDVEIPAQNVHVDVGGLGVGICDDCDAMGLFPDRVDYGLNGGLDDWEEIDGAAKFVSRKAQLYWRVRRALMLGLLTWPADTWDTLDEDATTYTYKFDEKEKLKIVETKDDVKEILNRSTDDFDALANALSRSGGGELEVSFQDEF